MALTDTKLRNLKPGAKAHQESDDGGLFVEIMPGGTSRTEPSGSVILNICDMVAPMAGRAKRGKLLRRPSRIVFGLSSA